MSKILPSSYLHGGYRRRHAVLHLDADPVVAGGGVELKRKGEKTCQMDSVAFFAINSLFF